MKKLLALVCALAMLVSCAALAEDGLGGLTLPLVDEEITLTMLYNSTYEHNAQEWIFQKYKEYTGIQIEPLAFTEDVFNQKLATYLASGNLPDIICGGFAYTELNVYGSQGAFVAIDDYLDITPNVKAIFYDDAENYAILKQYANQADGKNYSYPIYRLNRDVNHGFMYRGDIFAELDIEPWTDTDSFLDALRTIKEAYPESYPYGSKNGTAIYGRFASYYDVNDLPMAYDYESGEWFVGCTSEGFHEMLDLLKLMYNEGLLDPEFLTDTLDAWNAKQLNGRNFVMNDWIGRMSLLEGEGKKVKEDWDLTYGRPIGNGKAPALELFSAWGFEIANNEHAEAAVKFCDFLYSDFGSELSTLGVEGENFVWGEDGSIVYPALEAPVSINHLEETYGMWTNCTYLRPDHRSVYYAFTPDEQYAQDLINNECGYSMYAPMKIMSDEDAEAFNPMQTELKAKMETFAGNYIMNTAYGEAEWDAWVTSAMSEYGDAMLAILNK